MTKYVSAVLATALLALACSLTPTAPFAGTMKATVNGTPWSANAGPSPIQATYFTSNSRFVLKGSENGPGAFVSSITISVDGMTAPAEFLLSGGTATASWELDAPPGGSGGGVWPVDTTVLHSTFTVSQFDVIQRRAAGIFTIVTVPSPSVTIDGQFDVSFVTQN
jgi:hypothetical protein